MAVHPRKRSLLVGTGTVPVPVLIRATAAISMIETLRRCSALYFQLILQLYPLFFSISASKSPVCAKC